MEFSAVQDPWGEREKLIDKIWHDNQLTLSLDYIMDCLVCRGEILWLYLPDGDGGYYIDFFIGGQNNPDPEYKVFYAPGGRKIQRAVIIYSYEQELGGALPGMSSVYGNSSYSPTSTAYMTGYSLGKTQKRWVTLVVDEDKIVQYESLQKPAFAHFNPTSPQVVSTEAGTFGEVARYLNPFSPKIPVEISKNNARRSGQQGTSDFHWLANHINSHDEMLAAMRENITTFAGPTLVTTRNAESVLQESANNALPGGVIPSWASENRYVDMYGDAYSGSTNPLDVPAVGMSRTPTGFLPMSGTNKRRIATILGGIQPDERFAYIQPDPVTADQSQYVRQHRELLHWMLGGVDPLGYQGITFQEYKSLFGRLEINALKKAIALFKYGLCKVFENIVGLEERKFKYWIFLGLITSYPEQFQGLVSPDQITDEMAIQVYRLLNEGVMVFPRDLPGSTGKHVGLIPGGDRTCTWRFTRDVFLRTSRELLDWSIISRNRVQDGYAIDWVLRQENPEMTDQEIRNAQAGFSTRVVDAEFAAFRDMVNSYQFFMGQPDPENPEVPWGVRLGYPQMMETMVNVLRKELDYAKPRLQEPDDPYPEEPTLSGITQQFAASLQGWQQTAQAPALAPPVNAYQNYINLYGSALNEYPTPASTYGIPSSSALLASATGRYPGWASQGSSNIRLSQQRNVPPSPGATVSGYAGTGAGNVWQQPGGGFISSVFGIDPTDPVWAVYANAISPANLHGLAP